MAESSTGVNATSCPICFEEYNREANKPLVGQCGHSLCKTCYDSTPANRRSTCPTCNQQNKFANPTINFAYLELVDQINKGPKETKKPCAECKKSAVVNRFRVCVSCGIRDGYLMHFAGKTRIAPSEESFQSNISKVDKLSFCDSCEITGGHKGHPTILVTELMKDAKDESQIYQSHNKLCKIRTAYDDELERTRVAHINLFDRAIAQLNDYPIMDPISQANMLRVFSNVEAKMQKNVDRLKRVREHMERHVKNLLQLGEPSENSDDSDNEHLTYEPYHAHIPIYRQPSPDPRPAPMANMPPAITADGIYSLNGSMIQDSVIEIPSCRMLVLILVLLLATSAFSSVDVRSRIDCYPDPNSSSDACSARGCIWENVPGGSPTETPACYYPRERGYVLKSSAGQTYTLTPDSSTKNPFGTNIDNLPVTVKNNGKTLLVTIGGDDRYVPPVGLPMNPSTSPESLTFKVTTVPSTNIFAFQVARQSTGTNVWDTTIGGLLFADKYIQIATYLPSANVFGFGDHVHKQLMRDLTRYTTWPMFARDIGPDSKSDLSTQNLYGVHPFYIAMEADGNAHGVFFLNSNAQEVTLGPAPHLVYRTIGGRLDIAFFPGPLPEQVVQQYLAHIGTPFLPAYWALGYQLSRWGYDSLDDMKAIISRVQAAGVPLDIPYADIDYMNAYKDFTEGDKWADFPNYTDQLHQQGLHLIVIFDPAVEVDYDSFKRALQQNATFIEWPSEDLVPHNIQDQYPMAKDTLVMLGNVWPERNTAFPDFLDPTNQTTQWWTNEFILFHQTLKVDGMWIDMNEPSNFDTDTYSSVGSNLATAHLSCPISGVAGQLDNPPYATRAVYNHPGEYLCSKTLCMLGKSARRTMNFFDTKSLYGWSESRATNAALRQMTGKRGAVISRSTFPSSGRYAGHWLGDNTARWEDLQTSVINVMDFNFFGIPYVGSDICGFNGVSNEELCLRWHQMGAFHSFSRDHNTKDAPAQDPAVWPSVAAAAKMALTFRYYYLPYLYSLHYASSRYGGTVVRPVFFEFPKDSATQTLDYQFMWGSGMMIAPAVYQGVSNVHAYFPQATWYSLIPINYGVVFTPGYHDVYAATDSLTPVFLRGGYILPRQGANTTTTASRNNDLEVIIGVDPSGGSNGELYYDAGDDLVDDIESHKRHHWLFSFTYTSTSAVFSGLCEKCSDVDIPPLSIIEALGYPATPDFNSFILNGNKVNINVQLSSYSAITKRLFINTPKLIGLRTIASPFTLKWNHSS